MARFSDWRHVPCISGCRGERGSPACPAGQAAPNGVFVGSAGPSGYMAGHAAATRMHNIAMTMAEGPCHPFSTELHRFLGFLDAVGAGRGPNNEWAKPPLCWSPEESRRQLLNVVPLRRETRRAWRAQTYAPVSRLRRRRKDCQLRSHTSEPISQRCVIIWTFLD